MKRNILQVVVVLLSVFVFPSMVSASTVASQLDKSVYYVQPAGGGVVQFLGGGLSGSLKTVVLDVEPSSAYNFSLSLQLLECTTLATSTCYVASISDFIQMVYVNVVTGDVIQSFEQLLNIDVSGQGFSFDPAKYYFLNLGTDGVHGYYIHGSPNVQLGYRYFQFYSGGVEYSYPGFGTAYFILDSELHTYLTPLVGTTTIIADASSSPVVCAGYLDVPCQIGKIFLSLFYPDPSVLSPLIVNLQSTAEGRAPWGYVTILYSDLTTTATGTLPSLVITSPPNNSRFPVPQVSVDLTPWDKLLGGSSILATATSSSGQTLRQIVEPGWDEFVYVSLTLVILFGLVGVSV